MSESFESSNYDPAGMSSQRQRNVSKRKPVSGCGHAAFGFTLIELCVVCAVTMMIVMLMLPGLQAARTTARAFDCRNNLKRIGLALHNYHDVYQTFPPGWITGFQDGDSHRGYGWQISILPYIDQAPLFNKLNFSDELPRPDEMDGLLVLPLEAYQCPAASEAKINVFRDGYGRSNYTGNYGATRPPRWIDGRVEAYWPGAVPVATQAPYSRSRSRRSSSRTTTSATTPTTSGYGVSTGLFSWNSRVRIREVTDGTSNTIMVGERGNASGAAIWAGVGSNRFESDAVTDASHHSPINHSLTGYSSAHTGGAYMVLVDGSVRFVLDGIDSQADGTGVFQWIAGKNDGEVTPPDAFAKGPKLF